MSEVTMRESEINKYLEALKGFADIESISREKHDVSGQLKIKFSGEIGSIDNGEIEITFFGVEIMHLPFRLIPDFEFSQNDEKVLDYIDQTLLEQDCHLYTIKDDIDTWWLYAKSYEVNLLPVYYGN